MAPKYLFDAQTWDHNEENYLEVEQAPFSNVCKACVFEEQAFHGTGDIFFLNSIQYNYLVPVSIWKSLFMYKEFHYIDKTAVKESLFC